MHGGHLRWFGHVEQKQWLDIKRCTEMVANGNPGRGRPKKTWNDMIRDNRKEWRMRNVGIADRDAWRNALRVTVPRPTHSSGIEDRG